jgi:hypothetical protein
MRLVVLLVQIGISFVVTATVLPAVLFAVPPAREGRAGLAVAGGVMFTTFLVIWLLWPRKRRDG